MRNKTGGKVSDDIILTCIYTQPKFVIDNPPLFPQSEYNLGKVEASSVLGIPHRGCPKPYGYGNGDDTEGKHLHGKAYLVRHTAMS